MDGNDASCNSLNSIKYNSNGLYIFIVVQRLQQYPNSYNNCFTVMRLTDTHPTTFHVAQKCWSSPFYSIMHYEFHRNTKNEMSIMWPAYVIDDFHIPFKNILGNLLIEKNGKLYSLPLVKCLRLEFSLSSINIAVLRCKLICKIIITCEEYLWVDL